MGSSKGSVAAIALFVAVCLPAVAAGQAADDATPLHRAAHEGDAATVGRLLEAGGDVDVATRHGVTPLALASARGHVSAVEALLNAGADPNRASPHGETPLMVAARTGVVDSVTALLRHGAEGGVDAREEWRGQTALMWAAAEGHATVVAPLASAGADVDARSDAGFTPLAFAVRAGHGDTVAALVEAGADVDLSLGHSGEIDHLFRCKPITCSGANRSPVPAQTDHLLERSDAGIRHDLRPPVPVDGWLRFRIESPFRSSL